MKFCTIINFVAICIIFKGGVSMSANSTTHRFFKSILEDLELHFVFWKLHRKRHSIEPVKVHVFFDTTFEKLDQYDYVSLFIDKHRYEITPRLWE